MHDSSILD
jgi:hypothetical protein